VKEIGKRLDLPESIFWKPDLGEKYGLFVFYPLQPYFGEGRGVGGWVFSLCEAHRDAAIPLCTSLRGAQRRGNLPHNFNANKKQTNKK